MKSLCYDSLNIQEITPNYVQIKIQVVDSKAVGARTIFKKTLTAPLFYFLMIIFIPVLLLLLLFGVIAGLARFLLLRDNDKEATYEEAKEFYRNGKSYLANISEEERTELARKKDNLPLGL